MAEASVHGAIHRKPSGDRGDRTERIPPPPPPLSPKDLISALPDDVIHRIFSFLPLQDVVKTSILSKRWRSTWTSTTDLVFDDRIVEGLRRSTLGFSSLVDSVLRQSTSPAVKRFHVIDLRGGESNSPKLDSWLRFAEARGVEDLCLWPSFSYTLPRFLCSLSWLVRLEVRLCCFSSGTTAVRWPCLKVLVIKFSELSDEILEGIVRGSPVLESLHLFGCGGVKNVRIDSTSVKELALLQSNPEKIWAPHLLSLRVSGNWPHDSVFRLHDVSSLASAQLDFLDSVGRRMPRELLKGFLEKLRGVPTIDTGCCRSLQVLSLLEMEGLSSPLSKCRNLTLCAPVCQWDLPGIAYLLRSSQCLEKLVIRLEGCTRLMYKLDEESKDRFNFDEEDFLCSRKGNFECLAKHLRRVEIIGFGANSFRSKYLLALIKFLLGDAHVLEKLIIKPEWLTQHEQKPQAAGLMKLLGLRDVLSYRRASQNAEVILDTGFKEVSL